MHSKLRDKGKDIAGGCFDEKKNHSESQRVHNAGDGC